MSSYKLKQKQNKSHIPQRLNILFIITFICFMALFIRLGYLQLLHGEDFVNIVQQTESTTSTGNVPRGMIYDSQGKVIVGNHPEQAILFTRDRASKMDGHDIINIAQQLASLIEYPHNHVTERDKKDYFILKNTALIRERLSPEEKTLQGSAAYEAQLDKVTEEDIAFSEAELKIIALFTKMNYAYELSTVSVKNKNVTEAEIARVSEQIRHLPGISIGTDWQRTYPAGETLKSLLGQVSSEQRGLPSENAQELLKRGYAMNDRVGISYLEKEYEDALRGTKSTYNILTDNEDDILAQELIYEGASGDNLVLTIDVEFQKKLEEIAEEALKNMGDDAGLNDRVYISAINPKNGDILGIAGKRYEYDEDNDTYNKDVIVDDALGAINSAYGMGSTVKPAMVATGYLEDVISVDNNIIIDEPLKFAASQEKTSVFNPGSQMPIDDIEALQKSSNIYMIKLAMRIGGQITYEHDGNLKIDPNTIHVIRRDLAEFGLGTYTGIDLPNETEGFIPESDQLVNAIDLSYGQFDLYTPLQMSQYVATIANGGIRFAPRLAKEIRSSDVNGGLGGIRTTIPSKVMNIVPLTDEQIARIHEGMRQVSHTDDGTARYLFKNYPITVGSKTGTTEAFYAGPIQYAQTEPVTNATYVGFAPYDDPEIAISVVVPYLAEQSWGRESTRIAHDVMNAYFEMHAETRELIENYKKQATESN